MITYDRRAITDRDQSAGSENGNESVLHGRSKIPMIVDEGMDRSVSIISSCSYFNPENSQDS
jgi:hypothetical protein